MILEKEEFNKKNEKLIDALSTKRNVLIQPLDKMIAYVIKRGLYKNQTLQIFDQVGKQVRWLVYQLEASGNENYYFLSGGAFGVIGIQAYKKD